MEKREDELQQAQGNLHKGAGTADIIQIFRPCLEGGSRHYFNVMPGNAYSKLNTTGQHLQLHNPLVVFYRMLLCACGETKEVIAEDRRPPSEG